jgi:NADP-dependent 3-hydroxy acid dehydrogenase YdfG
MPFPYKKVLLIGASSGIGEALATRMVAEGLHVIVVGRRKERLDAFVSKHGSDKATAAAFDISELDKIPEFAKRLERFRENLHWITNGILV